jgi:D-sedoheptulose 7-phosphate isomerase
MHRLSEALNSLSVLALQTAEALSQDVDRAAALIRVALENGNKVLVCGNGGSAADAQHFAAELVGRMRSERRPYPAIALTTDTSILTAIANDYGWEQVFSRQVEAVGDPGDVLIGISTSGRSENVLEALRAARRRNMRTIVLTGPSTDTQRVQEVHTAILHTLCEYLEPMERAVLVDLADMSKRLQ